MARRQEEERKLQQFNDDNEVQFLKRQNIKELSAPSGIDARDIDHLEIISNVKNMQEVFLFQHYRECVPSQNYLEICTFLVI